MDDARKRFTDGAARKMRRDIADADGCEVFWAGHLNDDGLVGSVSTLARGTANEVLVSSAAAGVASVLIHNHPGGHLIPSEADHAAAASAGDVTSGFYIVDNEVSRVNAVVEPVLPHRVTPISEREAARLLSAQGPFAAASSAFYEERPSQIELTKRIARAFNSDAVAVFEAGTGVGKSLSYLIPSILWTQANKEKVVISTGTINLQEQLIEKDIPLAKRITGCPVKAVLLKGRQNYVCLRRLTEAFADNTLLKDEGDEVARIAEWAGKSPAGSRAELTVPVSEGVWSRIASESDTCMGRRCPHREDCFVMKVRKEAAGADLIVVNHHLLFADIAARMGGAGWDDAVVLPPYRRVIFDEAHGIEDSATDFFSSTFTRFGAQKQISLLFRLRRGTASGYLVQAAALSSAEGCLERAEKAAEEARKAVAALNDAALEALGEKRTLRVSEAPKAFSKTFEAFAEVARKFSALAGVAKDVLEGISEQDAGIPCVWETRAVTRRLEDAAAFCKSFPLWKEDEGKVHYAERELSGQRAAGGKSAPYVRFFKTPLDIAPLMERGVFSPLKTVVCVSATLKTGDSFSYYKARTGISLCDADRVDTGEFASPFPYADSVLFAVTRDAPFPNGGGRAFQSYIEDAIPSLVLSAGGRTLVLFTSFESLAASHRAAKSRLSAGGIEVFKQGDDTRARLLERFRRDTKSVLFATDSFWQGIDVPGESLSQVIMPKLPFSVPSDPVFASRCEELERSGKSSFMELSIPQAVIKFRQGFGRLIRRSDDTGVIVTLDRRIEEKRYGEIFRESLPKTKTMYAPLEDVCRAVKDFLGARH